MAAIEPVPESFALDYSTTPLNTHAGEFATRLGPKPRHQPGVARVMHLREAECRRDVLLIHHWIFFFRFTFLHRGETHLTAPDIPLTLSAVRDRLLPTRELYCIDRKSIHENDHWHGNDRSKSTCCSACRYRRHLV